jgi:hypothetical protein
MYFIAKPIYYIRIKTDGNPGFAGRSLNHCPLLRIAKIKFFFFFHKNQYRASSNSMLLFSDPIDNSQENICTMCAQVNYKTCDIILEFW